MPVWHRSLQRPQATASMVAGRDVDWHEAMVAAEPAAPVAVDSTHPCYILYTSGTTGLPKGVVRDTAGHMVALKCVAWWGSGGLYAPADSAVPACRPRRNSMDFVYDMQPGDVWWAASDVGWVVGHSVRARAGVSPAASAAAHLCARVAPCHACSTLCTPPCWQGAPPSCSR